MTETALWREDFSDVKKRIDELRGFRRELERMAEAAAAPAAAESAPGSEAAVERATIGP